MPIRTRFAPACALGGVAALITALTMASVAVRAQTPEAPSPLAHAKTIQVQETFFVSDKAGKLNPYFDVVVQIERPGKIRIDVTPLFKQGGKPLRKSLYLSDSTTEY